VCSLGEKSVSDSLWLEDEKIVYICSHIRGNAYKWYTNLETAGKVPATVEQFFTALTDAFGETDFVEKAKLELGRLRQTKSCTNYILDAWEE
ncbi:hypothetical protein HK096_009596, partial [Nowakowskiella sp. JEL0078]